MSVETVEEIKARLASENEQSANESEAKAEDSEKEIVNNEEAEEIKEGKPLSYAQRLDNAYKKLDETGKKAWSQGWRPQELFAGKTKDGKEKPFVSAEDYLKKSEEALPVAQERLREMEKKIEEANKLAKQAEKRVQEAEARGYKKAMEELEKRQRQAVEDGDLETFDKLREEEKSLSKFRVDAPMIENPEEIVKEIAEEQKGQSAKQNNQPVLSEADQQVLQDWSSRNQWFATDARLAAYAKAISDDLIQTKPYLSLRDRLEIISQEVGETFHNKFSSKKEADPAFDSGAKGFGSSPKPKGYSDLPANAKESCEDLIRMRGITGESEIKQFRTLYAKSYQN